MANDTGAPVSPEEIAQFEALEAADKATTGQDAFLALDAQGLADLSVQSAGEFDPQKEFTRKTELWGNPELVQKAADAHALLVKRSFKMADMPGPLESAKVVGKTLWDVFAATPAKIASGIGLTSDAKLGQAIAKVLPKGPLAETLAKKASEDELAGQRQLFEVGGAMEKGGLSVAQMAEKAAKHPFKTAVTAVAAPLVGPLAPAVAGPVAEAADAAVGMTRDLETPEGRVKELWKSTGRTKVAEEAVQGKGAVMEAVGGRVREDLAAAGMPVRPEEMERADPLSWWAFGKVLGGAGKVVGKGVSNLGAAMPAGVRKAAAAAEEIPAAVGGRVVEATGDLMALGGKATQLAGGFAPWIAGAAGAVKAGPAGALGGFAAGEIAARRLTGAGTKVLKGGEALSEVGQQISGKAPMASPWAQLGKDVLESTPGVAKEMAAGTAMDVATAAATSETPAETASQPLMGMTFGALGAAKGAGRRMLSGQLIAPRPGAERPGSPVALPGAIPSIEALHQEAFKAAPPLEQAWVNAVRQFIYGASKTSVYYIPDPVKRAQAFRELGVPENLLEMYVSQNGAYLPDKNITVVSQASAAPHEGGHGIQKVLGKEGNRIADEIVKDDYRDQWDEQGARYVYLLMTPVIGREAAAKLPAESWRHLLLATTKYHNRYLADLIYDQSYDRLEADTGAKPTKEAVQAEADTTLRLLAKEGKTAEDILTDEQLWEASDQALARELGAENWDALFKHTGKSLNEAPGVLPKFAQILGAALNSFGVDPLKGRSSEVLRTPLKYRTVEAMRQAGKGLVPTVEPRFPKMGPAPRGLPQTPEDRQAAADEARKHAETASDVPLSGGKSSKEILGAVAESIASGGGMVIDYRSAPGQPAGAVVSDRATRRAVVEEFRTMPEAARALIPHGFFPDRVAAMKKGGYQVIGWSPEAYAANAHKVARTLDGANLRNLSPYDIANGSFTVDAWKELLADTATFVQNQKAGTTGAGEPLVVPKMPGYFAPPETPGRAIPLDQAKADFINMLFNSRLPETPRIQKGKIPLNIAGQEVSAATKPGRVEVPVVPREPYAGEAAQEVGIEGRQIMEVNPLRRKIEDALRFDNKPMPSLIEAVQRLNVEHIADVTAAPELPEFRANTLTLAAGFQPKPEEITAERERAHRVNEYGFGQPDRPVVEPRRGPPSAEEIAAERANKERAGLSGQFSPPPPEPTDEMIRKIPMLGKPGYRSNNILESRQAFVQWLFTPGVSWMAYFPEAQGDAAKAVSKVGAYNLSAKNLMWLDALEPWRPLFNQAVKRLAPVAGLEAPWLGPDHESNSFPTTGRLQRLFSSSGTPALPMTAPSSALSHVEKSHVNWTPLAERLVSELPVEVVKRNGGETAIREAAKELQLGRTPAGSAAALLDYVGRQDLLIRGLLSEGGIKAELLGGSYKFEPGFAEQLGRDKYSPFVGEEEPITSESLRKQIHDIEVEGRQFETAPQTEKSRAVAEEQARKAKAGLSGQMQPPPGAEAIEAITDRESAKALDATISERFKVGGLTGAAYDLGASLTDAAQLKPLAEKMAEHAAKFTELLKAGDMNGAMMESAKGQFYREALQTATDGPAASNIRARHEPNYVAPFPGAQYQAKTEMGRALEEKGFEFRHTGFPGIRGIAVVVDSVPVGQIFSHAGKIKAMVSVDNVTVKKEFQGQGLGEALYRELMTTLKDDGVKSVTGMIVAPEPIALREKVFGEGATRYFLNDELVDTDVAMKAAQGYKFGGKEETGEWRISKIEPYSPINEASQFQPKERTEEEARIPGGAISRPRASYKDAAESGDNPYVRQTAVPDNAGRTLLVQMSSDLVNAAGKGDEASAYRDKLYSGARKGFARMDDFWEIPQWIGYASHNFPNADVYVVRDMAQAKGFIGKAGYDRIAMSALDTNKGLIRELVKDYPGKVDVGGYVEPNTFADMPNVKWHDTMESLAKDAGVPYSEGVDYRHFKGSDSIPRLTMSKGCLHKCAFCTVPKKLEVTSPEGINQQADAIAELGSKLVYLSDKTFGQASNYQDLAGVYDRIKQANPEFGGFVVQTTASQVQRIPAEWLAKSGIKFVELGIETYNDPILNAMHKPATESLMDRAVDKLRKANIALIPNIIIGLPGETAETYARTLDFLKRNADITSHANIYNLALYKDTELGKKIQTLTAEDFNENVLEKSFHADPEVHRVFAGDIYGLAAEMLNDPVAVQYHVKGERPPHISEMTELWLKRGVGIRDRESLAGEMLTAAGRRVVGTPPEEEADFQAQPQRRKKEEERLFSEAWITPDSKVSPAPEGHFTQAGNLLQEALGKKKSKELFDTIERGSDPMADLYDLMFGKKYVRVVVEPDTRAIHSDATAGWDQLPRATRAALEDLAEARNTKLYHNGKERADFSKEGGFQAQPPTEAEIVEKRKRLKEGRLPAPKQSKWTLAPGGEGFSKAWILPDGTPEQLGKTWHEEWLDQNPDVMKRYGIVLPPFSRNNPEDPRPMALGKGFVRIIYAVNTGRLTVEARADDWRKQKSRVEQFIEANLPKIDSVTVSLFNKAVTREIDSETARFFTLSDREKLENIPFITGSEPRFQAQPKAPEGEGWTDEGREVLRQSNETQRDYIIRRDRELAGTARHIGAGQGYRKHAGLMSAEEMQQMEAGELRTLVNALRRNGAHPDYQNGRELTVDARRKIDEAVKKQLAAIMQAQPEAFEQEDAFKRAAFPVAENWALGLNMKVLPKSAKVVPFDKERGVVLFDRENADGSPGMVSISYQREGDSIVFRATNDDFKVVVPPTYGTKVESNAVAAGEAIYANWKKDQQAQPKKGDEPEAIESAAIRLLSGRVILGQTHAAAENKATDQGFEVAGMTHGYVTTDGRFVSRREAMQIASDADQLESERMSRPNSLLLDSWDFESARRFQPRFSDPAFEKEVEKIKSGDSYGQTFDPSGLPWAAPKEPVDLVTLASVNIPLKDLTAEAAVGALGSYAEMLDEPAVVAGMFKFKQDGKDMVSVDLNAIVPQEFRENTKAFAKANDQVSIWDAAKSEEVKTGGKGHTRLSRLGELYDALDALTSGKEASVDQIIEDNSGGKLAETGALPGMDIGRGYSKAAVSAMTRAELAAHFPEAVVPRREGSKEQTLTSDITDSPLFKQAGSREEAIRIFADKMVKDAEKWKDSLAWKEGAKWYSAFVPRLKKAFGEWAPKMAELLAATSPQTKPQVNFGYAHDAVRSLQDGRFDKLITKYREGLTKMEDGSLKTWWEQQAKAGKIPNPPASPSEATYLAGWIHLNGLKPRQTNGKLYGQHSDSLLQVFTNDWLASAGPKTQNFWTNLVGTGHRATIDLWADRTMRRLGYEGMKERWRILPKHQGAVRDVDFAFAQDVYAAAAKRLGLKADALQGAMWFVEKSLWSERGWGELNLGDYQKELDKLPWLEQKYRQQAKRTKQKKAVQKEFEGLVEPRNL